MGDTSYYGLLRDNRGFRLLWLGTVVSFLGDWLTTVAVITMARTLSETSLAVAGVMIAKTLPIFLVSPIAGPLCDRVDRRLILLVTDVLRAVLVLAMVGCYLAGNLPALLGVLTLRTVCGGFFLPARTASVPDLATGPQLPVAMALNGGTWSVMLAVGAALGGVLSAKVGVVGALLVDSLTFLVSAAILWGLPPLLPHDRESGASATFVDGLRHLQGRLYLPMLLLQKSALSLAGGALVVLPLYAGGRFQGYDGPFYLGLLYASRGLGALVGSMGVRKVLGDRPNTLQWAMLPAYGILFVSYVGMAFAPTYWTALLFFGSGMVGSGMVWTFSGTLAQLATTRDYRGRLFSLEFGATMLTSATCSLLAGALLDAGVSVETVVLGIAGLFVLAGGVWLGVLLFATDRPDHATAPAPP